MTEGDLERSAFEFASELSETLERVLGYSCTFTAQSYGERLVVRPEDSKGVPLFVQKKQRAALDLFLRCQLDHVDRFLAVEESQFSLLTGLSRDPLLRLHFRRSPKSKPSAHWHVHAERGAFSALLTEAGVSNPHAMADLHLPVGGSRFRPCLEDFLEFLIDEVGIDRCEHARPAIREGRARWRLKQSAATVRDAPSQAAEVLRDLGYSVTDPPSGAAPTSTRMMQQP